MTHMQQTSSPKQNGFGQLGGKALAGAAGGVERRYASIISEKYCLFKATALPYKRTTPKCTHKHCTLSALATDLQFQASPCNSVSAQNKKHVIAAQRRRQR